MIIKKLSLLLTLVVVLLAGCSSGTNDQPQTRKPIKVTLVPVIEEMMAQPVYTSGTLSSKELIKLSFKISGIIRNIFAEEGGSVTKGKLLAQLELAEINARLSQAHTAYTKALNDYQRMENLFKDSVATEEQLQNSLSQLKVAESDLDIAQFNYKHASINAPASGKITKRLAEENELVLPGVPILYLASTEENFIVRVGLTEKDILKLQIEDSARIKFDAYANKEFNATVQEIAAAIDEASGTYEVELALEDMDEKLLTGFTASVTIFPSRKEMRHIVPIESLTKANGLNAYVFKISDDETEAIQVPVKVAFIMNNTVAIESGLESIEKVVKVGTEYLQNHSKVEVIKK